MVTSLLAAVRPAALSIPVIRYISASFLLGIVLATDSFFILSSLMALCRPYFTQFFSDNIYLHCDILMLRIKVSIS